MQWKMAFKRSKNVKNFKKCEQFVFEVPKFWMESKYGPSVISVGQNIRNISCKRFDGCPFDNRTVRFQTYVLCIPGLNFTPPQHIRNISVLRITLYARVWVTSSIFYQCPVNPDRQFFMQFENSQTNQIFKTSFPLLFCFSNIFDDHIPRWLRKFCGLRM